MTWSNHVPLATKSPARTRVLLGVLGMSEGPVTGRLDSWKQIAAYMGRTVRTVIRWEQEGGFPVHRVPVGQRQAVFAYKEEIDKWLRSGNLSAVVSAVTPSEPAPNSSAAGFPKDSDPSGFVSQETAPISRARSISKKKLIWIGISVGVLALASFAFAGFVFPTEFQVVSEEQITADGSVKTGLVADTTDLFFGELREGRILLSSVSVNGGQIRDIPTPFVQTTPVAANANRRELLVLAGDGEEKERALWLISLRGTPAHRIGNFLCHSAAWSPGGKQIAYASGSSIYITADGGATDHLLHTFAAVPEDLHWSLDGRRLLFRLNDPVSWNSVVWELELSDTDPYATASIEPLTRVPRKYDTLSPVLNDEDDAFLGLEGPNSPIFVLRRSPWPWNSRDSLAELTSVMGNTGQFAIDPAAHRLYMLKDSPGQDELDWFDRHSHEFRPFMPGISAVYVDFSRDGQRITYVRVPENTLWVASADGSSPRQVSTPGMVDIELPRWSPNGKQIAFMGRRIDAPYRIFVVGSDGGKLREASLGTDNQGAPTWSPDSHHLIYGRVQCQEDGTCAIEEIDLDTDQQSLVPGSKGLSTARWSPNGRYIAALDSQRHQIFLLDRGSGKWRKIADGVNGNDLAWAPNSRAVYASMPGGDRPEVIRISIATGQSEPAVDLSDFSKLSGHIETWFAITPDDSIIFLHISGGDEVYALRYTDR